MHLSAVISRLYKIVENRIRVYSKLKSEKNTKKINFENKPLKIIKMEKSPEDVIKSETDQKPR